MDRYQSTFDAYNKLASAYEDKFMDLDIYNDTYDKLCAVIAKETASILEVGCGPGNITKYILTKKPQLNILATDMAPNMLKLAKENNPTAHFKLMDCRDLDQLNSKFDAIVCGFCMPYLSKEDCTKFMKDASHLLNDNGVLYFSTIEGEYEKSTYETSSNGEHKMFVYYYDEDYLQLELNKNNFRTVEVMRKSYTAKEATSTHIIFIAKKVERELS